ncbi:MAG: hypothetical protein F6K42_39290, partial [Leptolyngbya sp. SIO1D8]|nr:hypothetical protein [Leptolyngbya sp. SIO1D8]
LRGGLGNDTLTGDDFSGGQGADTFALAVGEGTDTIVDFEVGIDTLQIIGVSSLNDLSLSGNSIAFGDEVLAILIDVNTSSLAVNDFSFVA